jgi:hypothetical protein
VEINADGMRDVDHAEEKLPETLRIATLGDSYSEARQVALEDTYWWIAGRNLASCPAIQGKRVEMLNFGTSGFGTTQELEQLRHRVGEFSPDIVVLQFTTGNDVRNNSFAIEHNTQKPYYRISSGTLILDSTFRDTPFFRSQMSITARLLFPLINHSRVLQLLNQTRTILFHERNSALTTPTAASEEGLDPEVYGPPPDNRWREAWTITEVILRMMAREVHSTGKLFFAMTASNGIQVHPDPKVRADAERQSGIHDWFYPERRIADIGSRYGFPVLTLAETMQATAMREQVFFHGFPNTTMGTGHWNERGHAFAGEALARFLCEHITRRTTGVKAE